MSPDEQRKMLGNLQIQLRDARHEHQAALEEMTQIGEQLRDLGAALIAYPDAFKTSWEVTGTVFGVSTAEQGLVRVEPYPSLKELLERRDRLRGLRSRAENLGARLAAQQ